MKKPKSGLFGRIKSEVNTYITQRVELSPGVFFSQNDLVNRIYKFANHDQSGEKINTDLSYNYWFDIISPRIDSEVKNLRFDTKNIMVFSQNPRKDFAAVFVSNASLKSWLAENGEDIKLKSAVEKFSANGNLGFKVVNGGYEFVDDLNTYITNQRAETVDDTDIIERHEMTASQLKRMTAWDQELVDQVITDLGNKFFSSTSETAPITSTGNRYEIFEYTGEMSEKEYYQAKGEEGGDSNKFLLAKIIIAGLQKNKDGEEVVLFCEELKGKISNYYIYAHRGRYLGRFWRVGMYELLFDHQIRANEIGNGLARGLEWASKTIFKSKDKQILQNIRADLDNGDVITTDDLSQVAVRMQGTDQLVADWNRLMSDADRLANSYDVVRGESMPSATPFRMGLLMDQNAGKLFVLLRQKITLPYKRVFREWILPVLVKDMKAKDVFRFTGEEDILTQLREMIVNSWYADNLVKIGPHPQEVADAIKEEKTAEIEKVDPSFTNAKELWEGIYPRLLVTITGENSNMADHLQDLMALIPLEQDPDRIAWILDEMYKIRGIPIPPKPKAVPQVLPTPAASPSSQPPMGNGQDMMNGQAVAPQANG